MWPSGQQVHPAAVLQSHRRDPVGDVGDGLDPLVRAHAHDVDLGREVAAVEQHHVVPEEPEVGGGDHVPRAGDRDDDVGPGQRRLLRRHREAVETGRQAQHLVGLHDRHQRPRVPEVRRHALAAGAVAEDRHPAAVGRPVGDA
jgi:hypothetical protein